MLYARLVQRNDYPLHSTTYEPDIKEDRKIALLIDCDNVSHKSIEGVIDELSKYEKWKSDQMPLMQP